MVLDKIQKPNDVKNLTNAELTELASEIRQFLIEKLSVTGGHLAPNLGVVELTIALHLVCDFPKDKIVWDVGHQSYTHKILTGRKDGFDTLRQEDGMSGFPKREESDCDAFDTGHSSTSISAGLGLAWARELNHEDYKVFSVIGDGALTGGMAFEGLNNASAMKKNFVIVLNDNAMSISRNVGGMTESLARIRTSAKYTGLKEGVQSSLEKIPVYGDRIIGHIRSTKSTIKQMLVPGMIFEEMGIMYLGPVNGHDIQAMKRIFQEALQYQGPVIVHVITRKGKGYIPAERHPDRFHGTAPYEIETGLPISCHQPGYTDIFSTVIRKMGERNPKLVAITAAMGKGTGLKRFHNLFPERYFDVGIAEEHAVTFAAALAAQGLIPVVAIYSSFLQRAYDQILHDVCLQRLHVIFCIDRAGLVGADGETHQGLFDLSYLGTIPCMTIMAPKNKWELSDMFKFAVTFDGPIAMRYPKGAAYDGLKEYRAPIQYGKAEPIYDLPADRKADSPRILLLAAGSMVRIAVEARELLARDGVHVALTNARFIKPLDTAYLDECLDRYDLIVTLEENVLAGGFGEQVSEYLTARDYSGHVLNVAVEDCFVKQGTVDQQMARLGMDAESVRRRIMEMLPQLEETR